MLLASDWKDYELLDAGNGEKLERWDRVVLRRPDPQAIWPPTQEARVWKKADAVYHRSSGGGGFWEYVRSVPRRWTVNYKDLRFHVEPTGFKHTGLFPEQAVNWDWIREQLQGGRRQLQVLNLFAYTGGATVAAAREGAAVCHVDAAQGMVARAKENAMLSGLRTAPIRFITDDVLKFIQRENRRGNRYDAIIMDPPTYGRGPSGELWKLEEALYELVSDCADLLTDDARFVLINSYTTGLSPGVAANLLLARLKTKRGGAVTAGEIGIPMAGSELALPCGSYARWTAAG